MENLLSASDLAIRLGVSPRTLEELISQGKVPPYIKLGRLRRWHPDQVNQWINTQFDRAKKEKSPEQFEERKQTD